MLDLLGNSDFWAILSGTLTALIIGGGRGYKLIKERFKSKKAAQVQVQAKSDREQFLETETARLQKLCHDLVTELQIKANDLARSELNYEKLERLYDRQFANVERLVNIEDELAALKVKMRQKLES